jgi:hypothetical protein
MRRAAQLLAVLCVVALLATAAVVGGKKPPGGDDPSTGGGTIYFDFGGRVWTMNSAGKDKTPLPVYFDGVLGIATSRQLHDGLRWFLQARELDVTEGTYPNGSPLVEMFAVSEDGLSTVQLTWDDPGDDWQLEVLPASGNGDAGRLRWSFDDARVSWPARLWRGEAVADGGIYFLDVGFAGGTAQPVGVPTLLVAADLVYREVDGWMPEIGGHDWAPDGASVVYDHWYSSSYSGGPLSIYDLSTGVSWDLTTGWDPEWSPDGGAIAFRCTQDDDPYLRAIYAINVDGSDRRMVFADTEKPQSGLQAEWHYRPYWSPTAGHLACYRQTYNTMGCHFGDVLRAEADGDRQRNLTKDIDGYAGPIGWR